MRTPGLIYKKVQALGKARFPRCAFVLCALALCCACSPRNYLTRRLAKDLISQSAEFRQPQIYSLVTGVVSNKDYNSPESLVLAKRGWIIGTQAKCPAGVEPAPCWDVVLSPLGVDIVRPLVGRQEDGPFAIEVARRAVVEVTGISKSGSAADVEFTWLWVPLNPMGAALYDGGVRYRSTVAFRGYDDGWRLMSGAARNNQDMDDALKNAVATAP